MHAKFGAAPAMLVRPFLCLWMKPMLFCMWRQSPRVSVFDRRLWYLEYVCMVDAVEPEMPQEVVDLLRGRQKRAVRPRANAQTALHTNEKVLQ